MQRIAGAGFWQTTDCYGVLSQAEYMDRIEAALRTAGSLFNRLKGPDDAGKETFSRKIITRLAEQLYLLSEAEKSLCQNLPKDLYLMIEFSAMRSRDQEQVRLFSEQLSEMYRNWSKKRRMRCELLQNYNLANASMRPAIMAISGLGCYPILQHESGLHVLEIPKGGNAYDRINARIKIIGQAEHPTETRQAHLDSAVALFKETETAKAIVVRRYRQEPSPLVRDAVRNYRTGLIQKVLSGDFDLFG